MINFLKQILFSRELKELEELNRKYLELNKDYTELYNSTLNHLEEKLNSNYPKIRKEYVRHETDGTYKIDVRNFYQTDFRLPKFKGTDDEIARKAISWVIDNIKYTSDKSVYDYNEYWAYSYQTLKRRKGDCDDGAILLANILLNSGVPYYKVRLVAGLAANPFTKKQEGHCYVNYYVESQDRWVTLDWCYFPNKFPVEKRPTWNEDPIYSEVWFSWNKLHAFATRRSLKKSEF